MFQTPFILRINRTLITLTLRALKNAATLKMNEENISGTRRVWPPPLQGASLITTIGRISCTQRVRAILSAKVILISGSLRLFFQCFA